MRKKQRSAGFSAVDLGSASYILQSFSVGFCRTLHVFFLRKYRLRNGMRKSCQKSSTAVFFLHFWRSTSFDRRTACQFTHFICDVFSWRISSLFVTNHHDLRCYKYFRCCESSVPWIYKHGPISATCRLHCLTAVKICAFWKDISIRCEWLHSVKQTPLDELFFPPNSNGSFFFVKWRYPKKEIG